MKNMNRETNRRSARRMRTKRARRALALIAE